MNSILLTAAFLGLTVVWVGLRLIAGRRFNEFIAKYPFDFQLLWMAPVGLYIENVFRLTERLANKMTEIRQRLNALYGHKQTIPCLRMFIAQCISSMYLLILLFIIAALLDHANFYYALIGVCAAGGCPWIMGAQFQRRVKLKQRAIVLELPEFLNKVVLLVNAGETVQRAVLRCSDQETHKDDHPLYLELKRLAGDLKNHVVFSQAMDDFNTRCGVQEVSVFCTTVLMNHRRGGEQLVVSLRALNRQLWEKRKALTRVLGEEAAAKLVFPMVVIFAVIMIIIAAPAVMLLNQS